MASSIFADECIAMKDVEIQQGAAPQTASGDTSTKSRTHRIVEIDKCLVIGLSEEDEVFYTNFSKAQRRRVRTKIDVRLLPVLCMLYMLTMLDRTNIGNAKIENLMDDIHLADSQYNDALAVFFLPYCLMGELDPSIHILSTLTQESDSQQFDIEELEKTIVISWGSSPRIWTSHDVPRIHQRSERLDHRASTTWRRTVCSPTTSRAVQCSHNLLELAFILELHIFAACGIDLTNLPYVLRCFQQYPPRQARSRAC